MIKEQIGRHTMYLGDCRDVLPRLPSNFVRMCWTDPPYGHSNHSGDWNDKLNKARGIESAPIENDTPELMREVVDFALTECVRLLKDDCCCCCCCGGGGPRPTFAWLADRMDRGGLQFFHSVIWDKKNPGLGWRFRRRHEMLMVAHKKGGKLSWRDNKLAVPNIIEMMPPRDRVHPNEKPVSLPERFIDLCTNPNDVVLDPFAGSGGTGVACEHLGRVFIGIECDAGHFETACERIAAATRAPSVLAPTWEQEELL